MQKNKKKIKKKWEQKIKIITQEGNVNCNQIFLCLIIINRRLLYVFHPMFNASTAHTYIHIKSKQYRGSKINLAAGCMYWVLRSILVSFYFSVSPTLHQSHYLLLLTSFLLIVLLWQRKTVYLRVWIVCIIIMRLHYFITTNAKISIILYTLGLAHSIFFCSTGNRRKSMLNNPFQFKYMNIRNVM